MSQEVLFTQISGILDEIQHGLLLKSQNFLKTHTQDIHSFEEFKAYFTPKSKDAEKPELHGGFAEVWAIDSKEIEEFIKPLKVTGRCMPLAHQDEPAGTCIFTGKAGARRMVFAKAY